MYNEPILITGAARSGTSMTAGIIERCGAFGGNVLGPTQYNKRGQYENRTIVDELIKPYLRSINVDPLGQNPLPDIHNLKPFPELRDKVLEIMIKQGLKENQPWYYKGAKICLIWPLWKQAFPGAKWVLVRRDAKEIVNSCLHTGFMKRYHSPKGWLYWISQHLKRFEEMHDSGIMIREVWPRNLFVGNLLEMENTVKWLELNWNADEVLKFIEPSLWSGKNGKNNRR